MILGETIYRLRIEKNMSQGDLADALGVSRQSVSKWENGNATPDLDKLMKMAGLFGVTLDELVSGEAAVTDPKAQPAAPPVPQIAPRKLAGYLLFLCGVLVFLVPAMLGGAGTGLVLCIPFFMWGVICFKAKENVLLWCVFVLYFYFWLPMGVLSPNFIRSTLARFIQLFHLLWGSGLLYRMLYLKKQDRLSQKTRWLAILLALSLAVTLLVLLFPRLLPTPGLLTIG